MQAANAVTGGSGGGSSGKVRSPGTKSSEPEKITTTNGNFDVTWRDVARLTQNGNKKEAAEAYTYLSPEDKRTYNARMKAESRL